MALEGYYKILGLPKGASLEAIKKAYRRMAMRYHPDRDGGSRERFLQIAEAYEVLTSVKQSKAKHPEYSDLQMAILQEMIARQARKNAREKLRRQAAKLRRKRELEQAKQFKQGLQVLAGTILTALSIYFGYNWFVDYQIARNPVETEMIVYAIGSRRVIYDFPTENGFFRDKSFVNGKGLQMRAGNGMPLSIGDEFGLRYKSGDPDYHRIDYDQISFKTRQRYLDLVKPRIMRIYRERWTNLSYGEQKIKAECLASLVIQKMGLSALAHIYYFRTNPLNNIRHNSWTWQVFKHSDEYQSIEKLCRI